MTQPSRIGINYEQELLIQHRASWLLDEQAEAMSPVQEAVFASAVLKWGILKTDVLGRAVARGILEALDSEVSK